LVVAELRYGAAKRRSRALSAQLDEVLSALDLLAFEAPADRAYGDLRVGLERIGRPIGANDMFIAAHALALGCTLVTANEREFSRVEGLRIENWLRPVAH
jgi:tRNA(fMet)-specific endonuclease VapC